MVKHLGIFLGNNLYDTKRHFSQKLGEALNRHQVQTTFFDASEGNALELFRQVPLHRRPDVCCSFYEFVGRNRYYAWNQFEEEFKIPFWHILTDPPYGEMKVLKSDSIISCVDHNDCQFLIENGYRNVFFFGHGVEQELTYAEEQERPYDVVYLGTSYDPVGLEQSWERLSDEERKILYAASDLYLSDRTTTCFQAIQTVVQQLKLDKSQLRMSKLFYQVGIYTRGVDRLELIRSIKDAPVHLFGGACFRPPVTVRGWQHYFAGSSHVTVHPAIPFGEGIEIMKKSKICLNSMPFFKNGTQERLFYGPACGCLMVTTDTVWARDHFVEGEEMIFYKPGEWSQVNEKIRYYLAHEEERKTLAENARQKVLRFHTWDQRAKSLLEAFPL